MKATFKKMIGLNCVVHISVFLGHFSDHANLIALCLGKFIAPKCRTLIFICDEKLY